MKKKINWDMYKELVYFIGECFGENVEVVLHDLTNLEHSVIAICNGHVTGREVGAPLTMFALNKIKNGEHRLENRIMNYKGTSKNGFNTRSSSFFIRDNNGETVGMLCINIDISEYKRAEEVLKRLSFFDGLQTEENDNDKLMEEYPSSMPMMVEDTIKEVIADKEVQINRLTANEKINIVDQLQNKGLFQIKGAVSEVAANLQTSEATIYRYLSKINKNFR